MDQITPDTALDGTVYMGPFFTKDGRYFYRDTHNQIWELSPTGWLDLPLTIEAVTKIWDPNKK